MALSFQKNKKQNKTKKQTTTYLSWSESRGKDQKHAICHSEEFNLYISNWFFLNDKNSLPNLDNKQIHVYTQESV